MTDYRRVHIPGATCFLTGNLAERNPNRLLVDRIDALRQGLINVRINHPSQLCRTLNPLGGQKRLREPLIKLIPFRVRQAHHERNQRFNVRSQLVEEFNLSVPKSMRNPEDGIQIQAFQP